MDPVVRTTRGELQAQTELEGELAANLDPERWGPDVATAMLPWQPAVDGEVVPAPPLERIAAGALKTAESGASIAAITDVPAIEDMTIHRCRWPTIDVRSIARRFTFGPSESIQ